MKLSDNFIDSGDEAVLNLELQVPVLNINSSAVFEFAKSANPAPSEFSARKLGVTLNFIAKIKMPLIALPRVRRYSGADPETGFMTAIQECIEAGILKNYLERKASEVINMLLAEYSYETDLKVQREEARQEGLEQGLTQGLSQGLTKGLEQKARETARKMKLKGFSAADIAEYTGLTAEEIEQCI